ncbi:ATP-binding cassette domain-containing protein [Companilactobacillus halodurans]|nr:AAA family ATPase [Companilactobacillus halodurans]
MKIEDFSFNYKSNVIFDRVNFYFEDKQINFVLGENGSGKTTLLDLIADVDSTRPKNFVGFPPPAQIAYLSQGNNFNDELTVNDILKFLPQLTDVNKFKTPAVIKKLKNVKFGDLSGGERRIVLVFINIVIERELYIFDEPETGIDLKQSQEIFVWLRELVERGKTVIITTHKLDNISDIDNVNYIKNEQEVLVDNFLKVKSRMAF